VNADMSRQSRANARPIPSTGFLLMWHIVGCLLLLLLPGVKTRIPFWSPDSPENAATLLTGAYAVSVIVLTLIRIRGRQVGVVNALLVTLAAFSLGFLYFLLHKPAPEVSRSIIAAMLGAALVLNAVGFGLRRYRTFALSTLPLYIVKPRN